MSDNRARRSDRSKTIKVVKIPKKQTTNTGNSSDDDIPITDSAAVVSPSVMNSGATTTSGSRNERISNQTANKRKNRRVSLLTDGYDNTIHKQQSYTSEEIQSQLRNYVRLTSNDVPNLIEGDRIKYFEVLESGSFKYKPGGYVVLNRHPDYLVITNGRKNWCVQLESHIVYKALDYDVLETRLNSMIANRDAQIHKLKLLSLKKDQEIAGLKQQIGILQDQ